MRDGGGGRAWEHPGKVEKAMECSIWALEDRGWWFHGELARGGGHGVRRRPLAGEGLMLGSGVQWEVREGAVGSIWVEEGRRRSSTGAGGRRRLHGDGGGTRPGRAASVGRCGGGLELGGGWNGAEGRARARRTNGGGCGSWAREQGPALAFMGEQGEGEGDGRGQGGSGSSGSGRGCRRAWRARRSGESARAACALEWG